MQSGGHEHEPPQKVLQIKKDDKFFSSLLSKEISSKGSEPSFRVLHYGGSCGAVPFMWESQPGIPKHPSSEYSSLPPLTPPPSYQLSPKKTKSMQLKRSNSIKPNFLFTLFPRTASKKNHVSPALSSSSSYSSSCTPMTPRVLGRSRSTVGFGVDEDDDDQGGMSPTSSMCFAVRGGFCKEVRSKMND